MMRFCTECGTQYDDALRACPNCSLPNPNAAAPDAAGQQEPPAGAPSHSFEPPVRSLQSGPPEPVSTGDFLGSMFLLMIPVVNLILLIVWAASAKKPSKRSWARAHLIFGVIMAALGFIAVAVALAALAPFINELLAYINAV